MLDKPYVILSAFGDEGSSNKEASNQYASLATAGLKYYSLRFINAGDGIKNVMSLSDREINTLKCLQTEYGLSVASIGSPIGKVKLRDIEDGTKNRFVDFNSYVKSEVTKACELAMAFDTKLVRGFSFYHPKGSNPRQHLEQAADQLIKIAEVCDRHGLTFGVEIEANLVGHTGQLMAELCQRVNHPALMTVFDCGNIICQGYKMGEAFEQYLAMKSSIGWMHVKDYYDPHQTGQAMHVDEELLKNFVPVDMGAGGHDQILKDFKGELPALTQRLKARGIPGVFLDLEPHLKGGGQFGGYSGPDGMGVALRAVTELLDRVGIEYQLRSFDDIRVARGY